ncbi:transcriptional regulator [Pseudomonas putida S11]|nr:transcriptional regulator [Pseudomonas putida S11]
MLGPGQRVPSVRYASQTHGVSPSTVFQAYYLLERRGLIRARPRSGYFVNAHAPRQFSEPQALQPVSESTDVDVSALVFSILDSIKDPNTVPFGSAFPSPELFPLQRLSRSLASASRSMDPAHGGDRLVTGQPAAAQADCPALHGWRADAADGGVADHQRRAGSLEPVPAGRHPAR